MNEQTIRFYVIFYCFFFVTIYLEYEHEQQSKPNAIAIWSKFVFLFSFVNDYICIFSISNDIKFWCMTAIICFLLFDFLFFFFFFFSIGWTKKAIWKVNYAHSVAMLIIFNLFEHLKSENDGKKIEEKKTLNYIMRTFQWAMTHNNLLNIRRFEKLFFFVIVAVIAKSIGWTLIRLKLY